MRYRTGGLVLGALAVGTLVFAARQAALTHMGKQSDGSFIVSTTQRVEPGAITFDGRPIDLAIHPSGEFVAVLDQKSVLLADRQGVMEGSQIPLTAGAGYRGALWSPDGTRLFVSLSSGYVQSFHYQDKTLKAGARLSVQPDDEKDNPRPGGMAITKDGKSLFVATCDRRTVAEIDLTTDKFVREYPAASLPFEVKLSEDEKTLIVSDWGGRTATDEDDTAVSGNTRIVIDSHGSAATGEVDLIPREGGETKRIEVGLHPTGIAVQGNRAYVANAASDNISDIDLTAGKVTRTFTLRWESNNLFGSMPCALAVRDQNLYVCDGGDNALAEIDLASGKVRGFRPAGYFPTSVALTPDGKTAFVVNTKGNGSVRRTAKGQAGNAHDFQGTVSVIDLQKDLNATTAQVAEDAGWNRDRSALTPHLAVYNGAIKHVLYIIRENRTYDEILGDMKEGDGDPKLCDLGENITPNAHAIARQFSLFDNAYVSGTNSADGHAWSNQALANDYLEHFYTGYRTYPDGGECAMAVSEGGALWNAALKQNKTIRVYGEFCDPSLAVFTPTVTSWMTMWKDRTSGGHHIQTQVNTRVASLRPYINPRYVYWPLLLSDQARADIFIGEFTRLSKQERLPNLMIMSLPSDHTEGRDPHYPKPQCMVADNDLALGRIVEAVSHSPQWKNTCICVIEDDAQAGMDHVDGHRTVYFTISPYTRRGYVDHTMLNTVSMVRSIELMLGLKPMNRFDALTPPISASFMETPDLSAYTVHPNNFPLEQMNPPASAQTGKERYWTEKSLSLDWSGMDRPDPDILNAVIWHTIRGVDTPLPTW